MDRSPGEWDPDLRRGCTAQFPLHGQQQDESSCLSEPVALF